MSEHPGSGGLAVWPEIMAGEAGRMVEEAAKKRRKRNERRR